MIIERLFLPPSGGNGYRPFHSTDREPSLFLLLRRHPKAIEIRLGPRRCVVEELARLPKPKAAISPRFFSGYQDIEREMDEGCIPSRPSLTRRPPCVRKEMLLVGISVVVEGPVTTIYKDVMPAVPRSGLDPDRSYAGLAPAIQKGVSENVACTAGEEDAIRQSPSHFSIILGIAGGSGLIHEKQQATRLPGSP